MKQKGGFILICLILTLGYFTGILRFLTENEGDLCEMTYMFEYPQYVKISNKADKQFKKYGLYAYSEGRYTEKTRNMFFDGIPVLFIPGNKGSYKQVRSMSSVALRKWLSSRISYHFDYFTLDLNEELSGLYGPLLFDQLQYVNASVHRILELYEGRKYQPKSIIIIGHSVGGIIASKFVSEIADPKLIPILITLATPLKRPPLMMDYHSDLFFPDLSKINTDITTVVSIGGGYKDILLSPSLIGSKEQKNLIHVVSSNIPLSWTQSNHVQILWCKQLVMALNRALFDSVDTKTNQISLNSTYRNVVFNHHLVHHSGIKVREHDNYFKAVQLNQKGQWIESLRKQYSMIHPNGLNQLQWYMVAITETIGYESLTVLAINMDIVDWVFACNAYVIKGSSRICREALHLTYKSEIVPSSRFKRRFIKLNLKEFKKDNPDLTHIVFKALPTDDPLEYHFDIHGLDQRSIKVTLPYWFSFKRHIILEETPENSLYYELLVPELNHVLQYYKIYLEPLRCSKNEHHASITLSVPWSNENNHGFVTHILKKPFVMRLFSSKPEGHKNSSAVIKLILDTSCTYKISLESSIFGTLGQFANTYTPLLIANVAVVLLMSLRYQIGGLKEGHCSVLFVAIQQGAKPYLVLPAFKIFNKILSLSFVPNFIPKPDILYLMDDGTDFLILPPLLYLISVGILWILTVIFSISLVALESTIHKLSLKLLAASISFNMAWSDYFLSYLQKIPIIVALTLISLSMGACGGIALCLGAVFYFLRLTQMSQDFVEEIVWFFVKKYARKLKAFFKSGRKTQSAQLAITEETKCEEKRQITDTENNDNERIHKDIKDIIDKKTETKQNPSAESGTQTDLGKVSTKKEIAGKILKRVDISTKYLKKKDNEEDLNQITEVLEDKNKEVNDKNDVKECRESEENLIQFVNDEKEKNNQICVVKDEKEFEKKGDKSKKTEDDEPDNPWVDLSSSYNAIFFHSTIFFLWCLVTIINIPAVLTWAHNFKYSTVLIPDNSFIPGIALSACALLLWQFDFPKPKRKWTKNMENFILVMAILILVFASVSIYRLNYILTLTIVVVTLYQLFAPQIDERVDGGIGSGDIDSGDKEFREKADISNLKMKME